MDDWGEWCSNLHEIDAIMKKRSKHLLRIAMAEQSFMEAGAMIDHILLNNLDSTGHLYSSCVVGAVVCYCRPFVGANGLGSLSEKVFGDFSDSESPVSYSKMHSDLLTARNKLCPHLDLQYGEAEFHARHYKENPGQIVLWLRSDGFSIRTTHTDLPPRRLEFAKKVITFQLARTDKQSKAIISSMLNEPGIQLGFHIFEPNVL